MLGFGLGWLGTGTIRAFLSEVEPFDPLFTAGVETLIVKYQASPPPGALPPGPPTQLRVEAVIAGDGESAIRLDARRPEGVRIEGARDRLAAAV